MGHVLLSFNMSFRSESLGIVVDGDEQVFFREYPSFQQALLASDAFIPKKRNLFVCKTRHRAVFPRR